METLKDLDLVRAVAPAQKTTGLRADGDTVGMPTMVVRFSAFGTWYPIDSQWEGRFLERTERGAFAKTMREQGSQVKVQFDHGYDSRIGSVLLGMPTSLREEEDSPVGEVPLWDTAYNRELIPGLEAGAYGSSFRFRVMRDEWDDAPRRSEHNPDGLPERTIKEVRLMEFGPVVWPANPDSTAGLRSLTDDFYARMRSQDPHRVEALEARAIALRTPDAGAVLLDTPAQGAANATPDDAPAIGHPSGLSRDARSRVLALPFLAK
jgi:HK97 family phage prohead protease